MIGIIDTSALIRLFIPDGPIPDGLEKFFNNADSGRSCGQSNEKLPKLSGLFADVPNFMGIALLTINESARS